LKKYEGHKHLINKKYLTEKLCYHGTSSTDPSIIYSSKEGIDKKFTTRYLHGKGTYFATNSSYSANSGFCHIDKKGRRVVLICRVFHGVYNTNKYVEKKNWDTPMMNPDLKDKRLDSITDSLDDKKRQMYVLFENAQAYPQYEIKFSQIFKKIEIDESLIEI
jgi:hypothetical protein